jgi:divalent metal cation (Fe/Co/Zn/Cd) transporter
VVIGASIVIDFFRARLLYRVASQTSSEALEADALHFGSDMWSSLAVLVGLVGLAVGLKWADATAAVVVALFVLLAGWRLGRRTIGTLIDTAPEGAAAHLTAIARKVPGVVSVERVRARRVGHELFVELTAGVSRALPMDRVATLKEEITWAIGQEMPGAQVTITTEPRALDDETISERVNVIARNRALAVHHVTVHAIAGRLAVSLDLEVDGELSLGEAHEIATGLEDAIRRELGADVEVETHIEPMQGDGLAGHDAPSERVKEVQAALRELAAPSGTIRGLHNVRVRDSSDGEIVNFHCHADPARSVQEVHEKVDELERALRRRFPSIKRVIGHAEPVA